MPRHLVRSVGGQTTNLDEKVPHGVILLILRIPHIRKPPSTTASSSVLEKVQSNYCTSTNIHLRTPNCSRQFPRNSPPAAIRRTPTTRHPTKLISHQTHRQYYYKLRYLACTEKALTRTSPPPYCVELPTRDPTVQTKKNSVSY